MIIYFGNVLCHSSSTHLPVSAFTYSQTVRHYHVGRCDNVKGAAISAIATLVHLDHLDLSGCTALTNDMLLPLSRSDSVPNLRYLSLVNNVLLSDATLQWLASGNKNIQHLSLRGTSIRKTVLVGTLDSFPNSDIVHNDNFFGFWPKSRVQDRIMMNKYCKMKSGKLLVWIANTAIMIFLTIFCIDEKCRVYTHFLRVYALTSSWISCECDDTRTFTR